MPIDRIGDLKMTFDEIVCTGVLHHLANPEAALRRLRDVLEPAGAMHLMVYAPYGRAGIYMLQEFCRRIGIQASDDEIRDLVVARGALPAAHPLARLLRDAPDFRQEAALADALLNPQDRAYSVPQLSTGRNTWSTPSMGSAASARSLTMSNAMSAAVSYTHLTLPTKA